MHFFRLNAVQFRTNLILFNFLYFKDSFEYSLANSAVLNFITVNSIKVAVNSTLCRHFKMKNNS